MKIFLKQKTTDSAYNTILQIIITPALQLEKKQ